MKKIFTTIVLATNVANQLIHLRKAVAQLMPDLQKNIAAIVFRSVVLPPLRLLAPHLALRFLTHGLLPAP